MYNSSMINIKTLIQGMIMGMAEIVPGVSGSTFALAMGIYERFIDLLHSISEFFKELFKFIIRKSNLKKLKLSFRKIEIRFGVVLVLGMLISIALFSNILSELLLNQRDLIFAFFFGLVLASAFIPWEKVKKKNNKAILLAFMSKVITFIILGFRPVVIGDDPDLLYVFFGGIVGISGLLLPGVSGSFILLMLGLYEYIINIVKDTLHLSITGNQLVRLFVFVLGLVVGFTIFVRILKFLFKNYEDTVLAILAGIMFGSLRVINPFAIQKNSELTLLFLILLGIFIIQVLRKFSK